MFYFSFLRYFYEDRCKFNCPRRVWSKKKNFTYSVARSSKRFWLIVIYLYKLHST